MLDLGDGKVLVCDGRVICGFAIGRYGKSYCSLADGHYGDHKSYRDHDLNSLFIDQCPGRPLTDKDIEQARGELLEIWAGI